MIRTAILLVVTLFAACAYTYFQAPALTEAQWSILTDVFWIWAGFTAYTIVAGELTGNCSQVDRLWSIVPIVYTGYAAYATGWDARATLMAALVAIWGARLTFNFARRGGYHWLPWKGEEDYRWEVLRQQAPLNKAVVWKLFNIFFICIYQMALIALFTLPIVYAWRPEASALGWADGGLAVPLGAGHAACEGRGHELVTLAGTEVVERSNSDHVKTMSEACLNTEHVGGGF